MNKDLKHGLGRRKTSIARVLLTEEKGKRLINGIDLEAYFPATAMQSVALKPLVVTSQDSEYGLKVKVTGGGKNSQSNKLI